MRRIVCPKCGEFHDCKYSLTVSEAARRNVLLRWHAPKSRAKLSGMVKKTVSERVQVTNDSGFDARLLEKPE